MDVYINLIYAVLGATFFFFYRTICLNASLKHQKLASAYLKKILDSDVDDKFKDFVYWEYKTIPSLRSLILIPVFVPFSVFVKGKGPSEIKDHPMLKDIEHKTYIYNLYKTAVQRRPVLMITVLIVSMLLLTMALLFTIIPFIFTDKSRTFLDNIRHISAFKYRAS